MFLDLNQYAVIQPHATRAVAFRGQFLTVIRSGGSLVSPEHAGMQNSIQPEDGVSA